MPAVRSISHTVDIAAQHLKARREVLVEMRTIIEEGVSRGEFRPRDARLAALTVIGMCNWVAWWFHPGASHPAEPVAGELAQNAVDMLAYPDSTGSPATAPHRALQMVRENLDYLERFQSRVRSRRGLDTARSEAVTRLSEGHQAGAP
jgi:Tetracyclin repressor-like, C-terminal domain